MKLAQQPPRGARGARSSRSQVGFTCAPPTRSSAKAGALLPFHPACLAIWARRGRGPGGAVANSSSGCVHPTPGPSSPSQLPAGPAEPAGELTLPGSQARPGPELCAPVRGRTKPNGLFQVAPLLAPGAGGRGGCGRGETSSSGRPTHQPLARGGRKVSPARNTAGGHPRSAGRRSGATGGEGPGGAAGKERGRGREEARQPEREAEARSAGRRAPGESGGPGTAAGEPPARPRARRAVSGARRRRG